MPNQSLMKSPDNLLWDTTKTNKDNLFNLMCLILIVSVFFTNYIHLRHLGNKVQFTEIAFLLTIPFIPFQKIWQYQRNNNLTFIKLLLVYLAFDLVSSVLSHQNSAILESMGRVYLFVLFILLSYQFSTYNADTLIERITTILLFCALCIIILSAYGYLMLAFNIRTRYLMFFNIYPYFGKLYRLKGPAIYPSMLISIVTFPLIYMMGIYSKSNIKKTVAIIFVLLFICAFLTLSKSILLLALSIIAFMLYAKGWLNKLTLTVVAVLFTTLIVFFTHVIVTKNAPDQEKILLASSFTSDKVLYQNDKFVVLETGYLALKRVEISMAAEHPFFGLGTGNFNRHIHLYKKEGLFPKKFSDFDPHCTYLGAWVENGIFALIALIAFFAYLLHQFTKRKDLFKDSLLLALFLILLVFLLDAISTDILNFRHLWVFMALAVVYLQKKPVFNPSSAA